MRLNIIIADVACIVYFYKLARQAGGLWTHCQHVSGRFSDTPRSERDDLSIFDDYSPTQVRACVTRCVSDSVLSAFL